VRKGVKKRKNRRWVLERKRKTGEKWRNWGKIEKKSRPKKGEIEGNGIKPDKKDRKIVNVQ
jgi:hypothetical protein